MQSNLARGLFMWLALFSSSAIAAEPNTGGSGQHTDLQSNTSFQSYANPQRKYVLLAPSGAKLVDKGGKIDISIQSPKGYAITVQTGDAKHDISLENMAAKLEAMYLGEGKPWSSKISGRSLTVVGLPAREDIYDGGNSLARVVITRGRLTDFVFIFIAPREANHLISEFEWVLDNFKPSPNEFGQDQPLAALPINPPLGKAKPASTPAAEPGGALPRQFTGDGFGFSINYPSDWIVEKPERHVLMFSGPEGTDAYFAVISISNLDQSAAADPMAGATKAAADLKTQINAAASGVQYLQEAPFFFDFNGQKTKGLQFLASYIHDGQKFRKLVFIAPRPKGGIVHIWSYAAPESHFERFKAIAESMWQSWRIGEGG